MADTPIAHSSEWIARGQIREALDRLEGLVVDGLKHGFFGYSIDCEIGNGGKRHLVIRAGKSHKFTIPAEEVPRWAAEGGDPCDGDAQDADHSRSSVIGGSPRPEARSTGPARSRP